MTSNEVRESYLGFFRERGHTVFPTREPGGTSISEQIRDILHDLKNAAASLNLMLKNLPVHFDDPAFREDALRGVSGITDAAAFGVAGATGATTVWAAVIADDRFSYGAVKAACRELQTIAPERILRMPSLPRTADGRVARAELVQLALGEPAHESTYL